MMLYLGTARPVPLQAGAVLSVEDVPPERGAVRQWFPVPHVYFVGAHTGCSCGFPNVKADVPIEYFDGIFNDIDPADRQKDLESAAALVRLLGVHVSGTSSAYLYPVWNGEEPDPPVGRVTWVLRALSPETMVLNERFMHEILSGAPPRP